MITEEILAELFREDWMDDDDWSEAIRLYEEEGIIEQIKETVEVGIKNGYSLERQLQIFKAMYKYIIR